MLTAHKKLSSPNLNRSGLKKWEKLWQQMIRGIFTCVNLIKFNNFCHRNVSILCVFDASIFWVDKTKIVIKVHEPDREDFKGQNLIKLKFCLHQLRPFETDIYNTLKSSFIHHLSFKLLFVSCKATTSEAPQKWS